jgi:hypothetical protein
MRIGDMEQAYRIGHSSSKSAIKPKTIPFVADLRSAKVTITLAKSGCTEVLEKPG